MYTDFTLKNFRVFDEEGINIPLRPITILTGCNNSGKSSITKALCLLKDFCAQIESDFEDGKRLRLERYKMDFHKKPNDIMGAFDLVVHQQNDISESVMAEDNSSNHHRISFEIVVESSWLLQDVILHLDFSSLDKDELNNGYLHSYEIRTLNGDVVYKASRDGKASMDFSVVKKSILHFLYGQYAFSKWQNELNYRMATSTYPADEDTEAKDFEESMNCMLKEIGGVALVYMLEWQVSHCNHPWKEGSTGPSQSILKNVEKSFVNNSPMLGVYCYFPCLNLFEDIEKKEVRNVIYNKISVKKPDITTFDKKIIDLFLTSFEKSDANTIPEFVSKKENVYFIDSKIINIGSAGQFSLPRTFWKHEINTYMYEDVELPKEANLTICFLALDCINQLMTESDKKYVKYDEVNDCEYYEGEHNLDEYFRNVIEEVFSKIMPGSFTYSPTTIVRPQRLYSLEDDSDFIDTIKKYFELKRIWISEVEKNGLWEYKHKDKEKHQPCSFINKWLNQLGIAHHVDIKSHVNGYGATIHLFDSEDDEKGMLLADKGFGVLQLFAFLLRIENAIIESQINDVRYPNYTNGLSEDLIKYLRSYNQLHPITIALEEPECHLHPSLQSKFAEIIADANKEYDIHFLIESHSEYFIRRLQLLVAQKQISNNDISLLYVNQKDRPSYIPSITDIGIETDGTLRNEFGTGFFDESLRLSEDLFKIRGNDNEE